MGVKKRGQRGQEGQKGQKGSTSSLSSAASLVISVPDVGDVSGLLMVPHGATLLYVMAHGAGAGMTHPLMEYVAVELARRGVGTLRYNFPYVERGRGRPDSPSVATATVRAAVAVGIAHASGIHVVAGGKSFGGRMTSTAQAQSPLEGVAGLAFLGFPLHRPGVAGTERAAHLSAVDVPMLFLQGTRDSLADLPAITSVCAALGPKATLHVVDGGDHSFKVPKASGRTHHDAMTELAHAIAAWGNTL